jgi:hypothetical protein
MPWAGNPSPLTGEKSFAEVMAWARGPFIDPRLPAGVSPSVFLQKTTKNESFLHERGRTYVTELAETTILLMALLLAARMIERGRLRSDSARAALVLITLLDLLLLGRHRLIDVGPLRPLTEQSPVLARLAREPRGTRTAGPLQNLPMLIGLAPVSAYRTLTLPAVESLAYQALGSPYNPAVQKALRASGTSLRIFSPLEIRTSEYLKQGSLAGKPIEDPELAGWLLGAAWVADQGRWAKTFKVWRPDPAPARAWLLPRSAVSQPHLLDAWSGRASEVLAVMEDAMPVRDECARPEEWTIPVTVDEDSWLIVSQLADPQWTAQLIVPEVGSGMSVPILPAFPTRGEPGGWQRVHIPGPGRWIVRLSYESRDLAWGLAISTIAWISWMIVLSSCGLRAVRSKRATPPPTGRTEPTAGSIEQSREPDAIELSAGDS